MERRSAEYGNSIYEMTDRELRAHRRYLRRKREQRRRMRSIALSIAVILTLVGVCVCSYRGISSKASDDSQVAYKYYTDVIVKGGDSLWTIADRQIDYEQYRSKQAYIDEVCCINSLYDGSEIRPGQRLIVPYYSTEYVR